MRRTTIVAATAVTLLSLVLADAGNAAPKRARDLGPTPVASDCLTYRGKAPCYYDLWSGIFEVDRHILKVGDTLTAQIETHGGRYPVYSWAAPGGSGLKTLSCPTEAPPGPTDGSPNYWHASCRFEATSRTNGWVVFGPTMGLAISAYTDGDYYAVVDGPSLNGRVVDGEGAGLGGVRVSIDGPEQLYAVTDADGYYDAIDMKPGSYRISVKKSKICIDDGNAISSKTCKTSITKVIKGNVEVNWRSLGKYAVLGRITDEFGRGVAGVAVKVSGLPGGEELTVHTDSNGSYRVGLEDAKTIDLRAVPAGIGPYELYYVMQNGKPSTGTAADVTPNRKTPQVKVNFELDRRLQFRSNRLDVQADGVSHGVLTISALTQHGDPAPKVDVTVDGPTENSAVICSTDDQALWPTLFSDGQPDTIGGFPAKTGADGKLSYAIYAGSTAGGWYLDVTRKSGKPEETYRAGVNFLGVDGSTIPNGESLLQAIIGAARGDGGVSSSAPLPFLASPTDLAEWMVGLRPASPLLKGLDVMAVTSGGSHALALFPFGQRPTVDKQGHVSPSGGAYVLDPSWTRNWIGFTAPPTMAEWANGAPIAVDRVDARTWAGYPIPVQSGVGRCLGGATTGSSTLTVHSPVRLLFSDATGRKLGVDSSGQVMAQAAGAVYRSGEAVTYVIPKGTYRVSVVGTGNGPVTIESHTPSGTKTLRFRARKGARATVTLAAGQAFAKLRFAGVASTAINGTPLTLKGLPKHLVAGHTADVVAVDVLDLNGHPVPYAQLQLRDDQNTLYKLTAGLDGHVTGFWPAQKKGTAKIVVTAPGFARTTLALRVTTH